MSKALAPALILGALLSTGVAWADPATPTPFFETGSILARARFAAVVPEDFTSSIADIGGHVQATTAYIPEVDFSYFVTPHISIEAIAGTSRHEISAQGSALNPGGKADVGSVWVLPPTITVQYHQQYGHFIPYGGVGVTAMFFYDHNTNNSGGITKINFDNSVGPTLDAGFDYLIGGHWVANFDVKQMFVSTTAHINGAIDASTALSPTVVAAGIGYRF
jgi:outer membrane protein